MDVRRQRQLLWATGAGVLGTGACALVVALLAPYPQDGADTAAGSPAAPSAGRTNAAPRIDLAAFEPIWRLDLRRPLYDPPPEAPPAKPPPPPFAAKLTGTVLDPRNPATATAMFVTPDGKIALKKVGDTVAEGTLLEITADAVRLRYYNEEVTVAVAKGGGY